MQIWHCLQIKLQRQDVYPYPPIVMCHEAWFDTEKAYRLGFSLEALKYSLGYWKYEGQLTLKNATLAQEEFFAMFQKNGFQTLLDYYNAISVDLKAETSEANFYSSTQLSYLTLDGSPNATKMFFPLRCLCHSFSLKPVEARLGVLVPPARILVKFEDLTQGVVPVSKSWLLYFATDLTALYSWPLAIQPGRITYIKIKTQKHIALDKSDNPCVMLAKSNENHTSAKCMANCQNDMIKAAINCQPFWMLTEDSHQPPRNFCNFLDPKLENLTLNRFLAAPENMERIKKVCFEKCPRRCERQLYEATIEGEDALLGEFDEMKQIDNNRESKLSITAIHITHDAMYQGGIMTIREVSSYSFTELVNNVGGTLGLFIGGTIMTFIQVVLFFVNYLCERHRRRVGNTKVVSLA